MPRKKTEKKTEEKILRVNKLSATCLETYYQCLQKYYFNYFTNESQISDPYIMPFGNAVHAGLEYFGKELLGGKELNSELIEEAVGVFNASAAAARVGDKTLLDEGALFIRERAYRHTAYEILGVELNFGELDVATPNGTPLNGKIDLLMKVDDSNILVVDYKTSRRAKTPMEAREDLQLSMYDYVIHQLYPDYKIWLVLDYLRLSPVMTDRSTYERNQFEKQIDSAWASMGKLTEKDIKPSLNVYCSWCGFKHLCPEFNKLLDGRVEMPPVSSIEDMEGFVSEYKRIKSLEKLVDARIKELKVWADETADKDNKIKFITDSTTVSWIQSQRKVYDPAKLIHLIPPEDLINLITFNKKDLEHYVYTQRPDLIPHLEDAATMVPIASKLNMRNN